MTTAEELLEKSIDQYKEILEQMHSLKTAMKSLNPDQIQLLAVAIDIAQKKTRLIERELNPFLQQTRGIRQSPRFRDRLILIEKILELTKKCNSMANALMVINRNEFKKIASGMVVLNTYYSSTKRQRKGGLINSSS